MTNQVRKVFHYWRINGTAATRRIIYRKLASMLHDTAEVLSADGGHAKSVSGVLSARFVSQTPLRTYTVHDCHTRRVSVITDSVGAESLFGGVGTALILAATWANEIDAQLRIITRTQKVQLQNVDHVLSLYGIKLKRDPQFIFAPPLGGSHEIDVCEQDVFITTSWWTTAAALPSVSHGSILYLLQEDERMFYPYGDERVRCEAILRNKDIRFLVNTKLLFDHFVQNGLKNIEEKGRWFEPAFPENVFRPRKKNSAGKRKFFFYARPNNFRNLFYLGIDVIEGAIARDVLNLDQWDIFLVGKDIPPIVFNGSYEPKRCENMAWAEYADLVGTVDMGLSLMSTPHPSYPPLDLVASGAVVVTNKFGNKVDLTHYSANLICADLNRESLIDALLLASQITADEQTKSKNFKNNNLMRSWSDAFTDAVKFLSREM